MQKNVIQFLKLMNYSIHSECEKENIEVSQQELDDIFVWANRAKLAPVMCNTVLEVLDMNQEMKEAWKRLSMKSLITQCGNYASLRTILKEGEQRKVKFVVFKGCVLADLYPQYTLRYSCDSDIFVYERDKQEAVKILEDLGYRIIEDHTNPKVYVFYHEGNKHCVELHFCLWEDYDGPQMKVLESLQLDAEEKLIELDVCGGMHITTLGHEEHLIYQMFHMIKHFVLQGISIRYISDITLFINAYGCEVDWDSFWNKIEKLGYDGFVKGVFTLGIRYLGLDDECMRNKEQPDEKVLENLLMDFINKGEIKGERVANWQILGIMTPYLQGESEVEDTRWKRNLKVMFPKRKDLTDDYLYAKKFAFLLPVAWVHRAAKFWLKRIRCGKEWYSMEEKLDLVEHRLMLLKELELVKEHKHNK